MRQNNPAGRLLDLLDRADANPAASVWEAWATALEVDPGDGPLLLRRLGAVWAMPGEIRSQVESLDTVDPAVLLQHLHKVEGGLRRPFHDAWNNVQAQIDDTARYSLTVISDQLGRVSTETVLKDDDAETLLEMVRTLIDEVSAADLPEEYRLILVRHLRAMQTSLEEVRVSGTSGIRSAVEGLLGSAVILEQEGRFPKKDSTAHKFWGTTIGFGVRLLLVLNLATTSIQLGTEVYQALPMAPASGAHAASPGDSAGQ